MTCVGFSTVSRTSFFRIEIVRSAGGNQVLSFRK